MALYCSFPHYSPKCEKGPEWNQKSSKKKARARRQDESGRRGVFFAGSRSFLSKFGRNGLNISKYSMIY